MSTVAMVTVAVSKRTRPFSSSSDTCKTLSPIVAFSDALALYTLGSNSGLLSFSSSTRTNTSSELERDGSPRS